MMLRGTFFAYLLLAGWASQGIAQEWAEKMFEKTSHDFGTVARNAATTYRFEFSNPYEEVLHVESVRSSCGCTTPRVEKDTLTTFERSAIIAQFNTDSHLGQKGATVTVTFDRPFRAQVQLRVSGYIRSDVNFVPGKLDFTNVDRGQGAERIISLDHQGPSSWRLAEVTCSNPHIQVEMREKPGLYGRVAYDLVAKLDGQAELGDINDQLVCKAQDGQKFTLAVTGRVVSEITVNPEALFLGEVAPGQEVVKKLIVRGKKPFKLTGVEGEPDGLEIDLPEEAKDRQLITLRYKGASKPGLVKAKVRLLTDLGENVDGLILLQAQVVSRKVSTSAVPQSTPATGTSISPLASAQ